MTTVDVVIPFSADFSDEEQLERAKNSAKRQNVDTEIIVINDEENKGPAWARNRGLEKSKNRYVAFLDADDRWKERKLDNQITEMKKTNSGICLTRPKITGKKDPNPSFDAQNFAEQLAYGKWVSLTSSIVIDTEKISTRFNEEIYRFEDHLFILEVINEADFSFIDEKLTIINKTEGGMSAEQERGKIVNARRQFFQELEGVYSFIPEAEETVMARNLRWRGRNLYFDKEYKRSIYYYRKSMRKEFQFKTIMAYALSLLKLGVQKVT